MLEGVGDVAFGVYQQVARQPDDSFIRAATRRGRQLGDGGSRDVDANHGEVAIFKFPNVRAAIAGGRFRTTGVRIRAKSVEEHIRFCSDFPAIHFARKA